MKTLPEEGERLWLLVVSPTIWGAHFLACYAAAAIACEKAGALGSASRLILLFTLGSLAAIAANGWSGWTRARRGAPADSREFDTDEDRHRFLGYATFLLAALAWRRSCRACAPSRQW